jgi:hypothetical protein
LPPRPEIEVTLRLENNPLGGLRLSVTVPVNPFMEVTVRVELAYRVAIVVTVLMLALRPKSCTVYATTTERDSDPIVPVTVAL